MMNKTLFLVAMLWPTGIAAQTLNQNFENGTFEVSPLSSMPPIEPGLGDIHGENIKPASEGKEIVFDDNHQHFEGIECGQDDEIQQEIHRLEVEAGAGSILRCAKRFASFKLSCAINLVDYQTLSGEEFSKNALFSWLSQGYRNEALNILEQMKVASQAGSIDDLLKKFLRYQRESGEEVATDTELLQISYQGWKSEIALCLQHIENATHGKREFLENGCYFFYRGDFPKTNTLCDLTEYYLMNMEADLARMPAVWGDIPHEGGPSWTPERIQALKKAACNTELQGPK